MSNQNYTSSSYSSFSSSSSTSAGQTTGSRYVTSSYTDPSGTTVKTASQNLGEPTVQETRRYDAEGREQIGDDNTQANDRRIEDVTDKDTTQAERDRQYEERMEDEYAKREGGA